LLRFPQVTPDNPRVEPRRPQALEAGLFLLVVALPLAFFPLSEAAFVDVKLLVLALGTLLVWSSGLAADRRLVPPALALGASLALATVFGVDRAASLVGDVRSTGITMFACAIALVVVAPSIPERLLHRARGWLVGVGVVVSLVAVTEYVSPNLLNRLAEDESLRGATFGNPVLLAGFLAASIPAALAGDERSRWRTVLAFAALGSGFAVIGERSAYLLPPVAGSSRPGGSYGPNAAASSSRPAPWSSPSPCGSWPRTPARTRTDRRAIPGGSRHSSGPSPPSRIGSPSGARRSAR